MARRRSVVKQLSNLTLDEVSLVDVGANQHAQVLISKRRDDVSKHEPSSADVHVDDDEDEDYEETGKSLGEFTTDDDDDANVIYVDDEVEKAGLGMGGYPPPGAYPNAPQPFGQPAPGPQNFPAQGFPSMPGQMPAMMPGQMPGMPGQMPGQPSGAQLPPEVIQYIKSLEMQLAQAQGGDKQQATPDNSNGDTSGDKVNPFGKAYEGDDLSGDEMSFLEELAKNLDDEDTRETVNKALEAVAKAQARAEAAEEIAKAERDHRLNAEYVAKAQAFSVGVAAEELGPVLKRLNEALDAEDVAVIEKALKSASAQSSTPFDLFTEVGKRGGGDNGDVMARVDAEAQEYISKGLSPEQARAAVYEANPALYDESIRFSGR